RNLARSRTQRRERDLELVELAVPALVDARVLRGGADEEPREEIREGWMVLPVGEEAREQVRTPQERAVERMRGADDDVVSAAGADRAAVDQELLGREPAEARLLVERERVLPDLLPGVPRMDVRLDHAGIGRDRDAMETRVRRRRVAFDPYRRPHVPGHVPHPPH